MNRKLGFDLATIETDIKVETDTLITVPAVIAREIVHPYGPRMAYKDADELEKAAWTINNRWLVLDDHPPTRLLVDSKFIAGVVENPVFVKNLVDPKTNRPMDRGILADLTLWKNKMPTGWVDQLKQGLKKSVSIGFTFTEDNTPGEWRGQKYDYVQRDLFLDHVAVGVPVGRCPTPYCGVGVDSIIDEQDTSCPIGNEMRAIGINESCKRLAAAYGTDAIRVLKGEPAPNPDVDQMARSRELVKKFAAISLS